MAGLLKTVSDAAASTWWALRGLRRRPVQNMLQSQRRLRQPEPDGSFLPPDYNIIFSPNPDPVQAAFGSHLDNDLERFWEQVVLFAFITDRKVQAVDVTRKPLLYLLASVGRGKTLFLREAAHYVCRAVEHNPILENAVVMGISFNGSFRLLDEELQCVKYERGYYLLLLVRILFCELAYFGAAPRQLFTQFVEGFYMDLDAGRFSVTDVRNEVRALFLNKARRGGPSSKLVLFVDEINNLLTTQVGARVCGSLGMDVRYPVRSEACSLTDLAGGVSVMTSLEAGLMLDEQTVSGRSARVVQEIEPPPFHLLVSLMFRALSERQRDPRDSRYLIMSIGAKRTSMKLLECAEIYAVASGSTWRTAINVFIMLSVAAKLDFLEIMQAVDIRSSVGLLDRTPSNPLPNDLWSTSPAFRDAVLASTILSQNVRADTFVLPRASGTKASAAAAATMLDIKPATWSDATVDDKAREELAKEKFSVGQLRAEEDLCYGDVRALGLVTAGGNRIFQPELTCLSLAMAVSEPREPSILWDAFVCVMQVVSEKGEPVNNQAAAGKTDQVAAGMADQSVAKLMGVRWEQFVLRWEGMHSIARSFHEPKYSAITLRELYGGGATYVGDCNLLQDELVNAAVARKVVKKLRGKNVDGSDRLETVTALLSSSYSREERCKTVYELPTNCPCFDGAFFFETRDGEVVVWVQTKTRGAAAFPANNVPAILKALNERKTELISLFGGQEQYDYWLSRSCYLYVLDNDLASSEDVMENGDWTQRSIVRTRGDLVQLFGRTFVSAGRLVRLLDEAGLGAQ